MANKLTRLGGPGKFGAWVRYGGKPITQQQLDFAVKNYSVAILQPWELDAARYLKKRAPQMVVLAYKCLSSTRSYEPGPIYSSGVSYPLAQSMANSGKDFFAHRLNGDRIEWKGYSKHYQMQVWNPGYRWYWVDAVVREMRDSPFDGVMADNDVENDYYDLNLPIQGVESMTKIREHLDFLVAYAGIELNKIGKILVPNIAEARLRWGKWERHSAYGGGFEEVWLGWGPNDYLTSPYAVMQGREIANGSAGDVNLGATFAGLGGRSAASQKKVTILRTPLSDRKAPITGTDENFLYGLAGFWVFGGGAFTGISATHHDAYDEIPHAPELSYDLGDPVGGIIAQKTAQTRAFTNGWAALNTGSKDVTVKVPSGLVDAANRPVPSSFTLRAHQGVVYRRKA
ncbi:Uncharacterised protein [Mycobacterium tuberculosis]|nr:Uncharacterised protein [Mycobacterium tuberculosis]